MDSLKRKKNLDVMKGIAIVFIIITHAGWKIEERNMILFPFWIDMAVPVFMIISGYLYALSYKKHGIKSIGQAYTLEELMPRFIRFIVPFSIVYFVELILDVLTKKELSFFGRIVVFFTGGLGPGAYYVPIMIQFVLIFPIIFAIIRKFKTGGGTSLRCTQCYVRVFTMLLCDE